MRIFLSRQLARVFLCYTFLLILSDPLSVIAQKKSRKAKEELELQSEVKSPFKRYDKVITNEAETQKGLFTVHKVNDKYYFEIPISFLGREVLLVSKVSKGVKGVSAGITSNQQVIKLQRMGDCIWMRLMDYGVVENKGLEISKSVKANNFEAIAYCFKIITVNDHSNSCVVEVNDFFTGDIPMIGPFSKSTRRYRGISGVDKSRSSISWIKAHVNNVEVRHILTFSSSNTAREELPSFISIEMNQSFVLLPENPMKPRFHDYRLNHHYLERTDYGLGGQKARMVKFIHRWRLEPSNWDIYNKGELVEPIKPIVFYLDPAIPEKWKPYFKQGVEDWQKAFEEIGFKNAILVKNPPNEPGWSSEDIRYSVIRYRASQSESASASYVHDPRTGEILSATIAWSHNMVNRLRNWFFVQTAAANPAARGGKFKDEVMGELMRSIISHEAGHALGLSHNWGASVSYSVDSLRSPAFTSKHGTASSIMDYARFNYVAQPEDSITNFHRQIREFDHLAIKYGYKLLPNVHSPEEEKKSLDQWIWEKGDNWVYQYRPYYLFSSNPAIQTEDLGNDAMLASELGIRNLKRTVNNLIDWSSVDRKGTQKLEALYEEVFLQFEYYINHVKSNVGGIYEHYKLPNENWPFFEHVSRPKQQKAVHFLKNQLFDTPIWLTNKEIQRRVSVDGNDQIIRIQKNTLSSLMDEKRLKRMIENETLNGKNAYSTAAMFNDLQKGIYCELETGAPISNNRRNLQKYMTELLGRLMNNTKIKNTDIHSIARANLVNLRVEIKNGLIKQNDLLSKYHLKDLAARIDKFLSLEHP